MGSYSRGFILHCTLLFATFLILTTPHPALGEIMDVRDFFEDVRDDLTKITWAHAVNSKSLLKKALNNDIMMLEADILMGKKEGSEAEKLIPIMAHPPDTTSDLTFDDFLSKVIDAVNKGKKKKGIKLDFKDIEAVTPALKIFQKRESKINFPVWVNADIFLGPVEAKTNPLDATTFIEGVQHFANKATISIGWTTRYGFDDDPQHDGRPISEGVYTMEQVKDALKFLDESKLDISNREVTFPVRAGIAAQSIDQLMTLLGDSSLKTTLTLWSKEDDPVNSLNLTRLIDNVGRSRCYADLPPSLNSHHKSTTEHPTTSTSPSTTSSSTKKDKHSKKDLITVDDDEVEPKDENNVNGAKSTVNSGSVVAITCVLMICIAAVFRN